jgi:hypothetical protein
MKNQLDQTLIELKEAELIAGRLPCGDDRARKMELARRGIEILANAEGEAERGRVIDKHIKQVRQIIFLILK